MIITGIWMRCWWSLSHPNTGCLLCCLISGEATCRPAGITDKTKIADKKERMLFRVSLLWFGITEERILIKFQWFRTERYKERFDVCRNINTMFTLVWFSYIQEAVTSQSFFNFNQFPQLTRVFRESLLINTASYCDWGRVRFTLKIRSF